MRVLTITPGTEAHEEALRGFVRAERINDIVAAADTKAFRDYLAYCRDDYAGEEPIDPDDQYRHRDERLRLVERAIDAYERKHGVAVARGRIYQHGHPRIAAAPDGVESDLIGLTVHVHFGSRKRSGYDCYRDAVREGVTPAMRRHAIAMGVTTRLPNWIHIHYFEDAEMAMRKMFELDVTWSKAEADDMRDALVQFARRVARDARRQEVA